MTARPAVESAAAREFLVTALRARRQTPGLLLLSLPAAEQPLESLWAALPGEPAMLWEPPAARTNPELDAAGRREAPAARTNPELDAAVPGEPPAARTSLAPDCEASLGLGEVLDYRRELPVTRIAPPGQALGSLRWFAARPFSGPVNTPPWTDFPAGTTMLPRWRYARTPQGCAWHLTVHTPTDALIDQVVAEFGALTQAGAPLVTSPPQVPLRREDLPFALWQKWLQRILHAIAAGQVDKVVAARYTTLVFPQPVDVAAVLTRLRTQAPQATRFALRRGPATFFGATPELLLRKRGQAVTTEALAGTLARTGAPLAELSAQLLASDKDRREHALVVAAIQQRLEPLCHAVSAATTPQLRALPHLLHLHTPIHATTRTPDTDLDALVTALHPTPAMGGTPTVAALQLIAAYEPQPRGYYAGPVGWWDERGDGEFAVAIRSGVVIADTAYVYAGAGIVRGSEPELEYAETAAKMRTLLDALTGSPTTLLETPR